MSGTDRNPGLGDYLSAVYRTGNHCSIEGIHPPSNNGLDRLVQTSPDYTDKSETEDA